MILSSQSQVTRKNRWSLHYHYLSSVLTSESLKCLFEAVFGVQVLPVSSPSAGSPRQLADLIQKRGWIFQNRHRYPPHCHVCRCRLCRVVGHRAFLVVHPQPGWERSLKSYVSFLQSSLRLCVIPPLPSSGA